MSLIIGFTNKVIENLNSKKDLDLDSEFLCEFTLSKPFPMRLEFYVEHFLYQLNLPESLLPLAYALIKGLKGITPYNMHRIVFVALVLSYKFSIDDPVSNFQLEKIGGLQPGKLSKLEIVLLEMSDWRFHYQDYEMLMEQLVCPEKTESFIKNDDEDLEDQETDITGYDTNDSFSELSAFFSI
jgi:Cyclin